jgi:glucose-1-phosphate adenylyltransferase
MASDPGSVLAVIMGGGRGTRLSPLTAVRSKPAVPIAGKYRLIDIPISNCINSGIYHIAVLTQFNSVSLHRHISRAYRFDAFHSGWVQIWAAEQTIQSADWYQGTADAVRKQIAEIRATGTKYVLILAGDHLYRMDYARMAEYHWEKNADITVAVHPVPREEAGRLGILKVEKDGRISDFVEKPQDPAVVDHFVSRPDPAYPLLGSMGIYLFNVDVLADILAHHPSHTDFGIDIIPDAVRSHAVFGLAHEGYWRDIGTIRAYYETNLMLAAHDSPFNFYDPKLPIYTHEPVLPGSVIEESMLTDVLIAEGCRVQKAQIEHSVVGIRSQVGSGTRVAHSVLNGLDFYSSELGIGPHCDIEGAILDKNVRLEEGVVIRPFPRGTELTEELWQVRDGIVVLPKDASIPAGTRIAPPE